jgi:hypothetical protein
VHLNKLDFLTKEVISDRYLESVDSGEDQWKFLTTLLRNLEEFFGTPQSLKQKSEIPVRKRLSRRS